MAAAENCDVRVLGAIIEIQWRELMGFLSLLPRGLRSHMWAKTPVLGSVISFLQVAHLAAPNAVYCGDSAPHCALVRALLLVIDNMRLLTYVQHSLFLDWSCTLASNLLD